MQRKTKFVLGLGIVLGTTAGIATSGRSFGDTGGADRPITVESLLGRMVDLNWLAAPPAAGERTVQFSSYDRATKLVDGQLQNRYANGDRGHYQRVDTLPDGSQEFVLAETEGPGYISRIWSANPAGELRIYIDGSKTPALAADFVKLTNGEVAPLGAPFGHDASSGRNLYFPFPFARSIKVVTSQGDQYYQVAVTYVPKRTAVESYAPAALDRARSAIEETGRALLDPDRGRPALLQPVDVAIAPGKTADLVAQPGAPLDGKGGMLNWIRLANHGPATGLSRALLLITCDDAREPQVAVPLGEFFGSGPGLNPFQTAVAAMRSDGAMTCRWPMPFAKSVRLQVRNFDAEPIKLTGELGFDPTPPPSPCLHFFARWRYQDGLRTVGGDGTQEWPALRVKGGPGRFVGLLLDIFNPVVEWWGEGDEKIYVDGESFPSTFGTGTEDYFGYAWSSPQPYTNPFHAQTRADGPGNHGYASNVRIQALDQVPWHQSLAFDLEVWHWKATTVQYATVAFFYAAPGTTIEPGIPDLSNRVIHKAALEVRHEPGAIEAESLKVLKKTGGQVPNQDMRGFGLEWSGGSQLWWVEAPQGALLELALPVESRGTFDVAAAFTRAPDYGQVALAIDGAALGDPIDLFAPKVEHSGALSLGRATLEPGPHSLTLTITGRNPKSRGSLVGVDWFKLTPAK